MMILATIIRALYQKSEWRSRIGQAAAKASPELIRDRNAAAVKNLRQNPTSERLQPGARRPQAR
jgi:hypothetical protein